MSATHAGSTSEGNLCHLLVRRARNLAMSKSVVAVFAIGRLSTVARGPWGGQNQRTYHPAATPTPHQEFDCRRPSLTAIRAAQGLIIDNDLVRGYLQFEGTVNLADFE